MKKYLIGAWFPIVIILYLLFLFIHPFWLAYQNAKRQRHYAEYHLANVAENPYGLPEPIKFLLKDTKRNEILLPKNLYTSQNWQIFLYMVADSINAKDPFHIIPQTFKFILDKDTVAKTHLRIWNKRKNGRDLLCETIAKIILSSRDLENGKLWLPAVQTTHTKVLKGATPNSRSFSVENVFKFHTVLKETDTFETKLSLIQHFSAMKDYSLDARFEERSSISSDKTCISFTLMSFKIISKNNTYKIMQDESDKETLKENKYFFNEDSSKRIGLKYLGLDMFEVGTIEIEVVK